MRLALSPASARRVRGLFRARLRGWLMAVYLRDSDLSLSARVAQAVVVDVAHHVTQRGSAPQFLQASKTGKLGVCPRPLGFSGVG